MDTFKKETSNLKSLQMKIEKERMLLNQKTADFEKQKANEETKIEKWMQRLKQEKSLLERQKKETDRRNKSTKVITLYF